MDMSLSHIMRMFSARPAAMLARLMLLLYLMGSFLSQWNVITHTLYHLATHTDYRHVHHTASSETAEHHHAFWMPEHIQQTPAKAPAHGQDMSFSVMKHLPVSHVWSMGGLQLHAGETQPPPDWRAPLLVPHTPPPQG